MFVIFVCTFMNCSQLQPHDVAIICMVSLTLCVRITLLHNSFVETVEVKLHLEM